MTRIDRHLLGRLGSTFLKTLLGLVLLFVVVDLLTHRRTEILRHDIPWGIVFQYYFFLTPKIIGEYQVGAMSVLIATLMVVGSASQHGEMIALFAGGVSLWRIVMFPLSGAALLSVILFIFMDTAGAKAVDRASAIERLYFARNPEGERPGVSWSHLPGEWKCHIMKFNRIALTGEDVLMLAVREKGVEEIRARRIFWDEERASWILEDGLWSVFHPDRAMGVENRRITQIVAPIPETPQDLFALNADTATLDAGTLSAYIRRAQERGMPTTRLSVDWHGKFAKPALAFVMMVLAIPFAMRLRRSGLAMSFGTAILVALAYLVFFAVAQSFGYTGRLSPLAAAWSANALFLVVGLTFLARTPT